MRDQNNFSVSASSGCGCGCGCITLIATILVLYALWFGLPVNEKKWNIDIFPPRIWDMNYQKNNVQAMPPNIENKTEEGIRSIEKN